MLDLFNIVGIKFSKIVIFQNLLHTGSSFCRKSQNPIHKPMKILILTRNELCFIDHRLRFEHLNSLFRHKGLKLFHLLIGRHSSPCQNLLKLILSRRSRKHSLSFHKLSHETAKTPHINRLFIMRNRKKYLWCPVPSGSNIISHDSRLKRVIFFQRSDQTKITKLNMTVLINKNIRRFEISMNDLTTMTIKQ